VGIDDPKSKIVISTKAEILEANRDHLLSRKKSTFPMYDNIMFYLFLQIQLSEMCTFNYYFFFRILQIALILIKMPGLTRANALMYVY
jgi:hypothetical protein